MDLGILVALDPGGTTGIAKYHNGGFETKQIGPEPHYYQLYRYLRSQLRETSRMTVICESFQNRGMDKELISCELIGVVHFFSQLHSVDIHFQTAAEGKGGFWKEREKIQKVNLWRPNQKHAMDAMRHLLQYMVFTCQRMDLLEKLK